MPLIFGDVGLDGDMRTKICFSDKIEFLLISKTKASNFLKNFISNLLNYLFFCR